MEEIENFQKDEEEDFPVDKITEESIKQEQGSSLLKKAREGLFQKGGEDGKVPAIAISSAKLALEQMLYVAPVSKEKLESLGLEEYKNYFISGRYIPYKDKAKNIYFFEKKNGDAGSDFYKLQFYVSSKRKPEEKYDEKEEQTRR